MALTLPAAWLTAFRSATTQPVYLVSITTDGPATYKAIDGYHASLTYPASVGIVTPVVSEMDPFTRKAQVGQCSIDFLADGWMKAIVVAKRLRGKKVVVSVGNATLAEADFAPVFSGVVDAVHPREDGSVELECSDAFAILRDKTVQGYWVMMHPLEIIEDLLEKAEVPADLYDATTLAPTAYTTTISHWCTTRGGANVNYDGALTVRKPTPAIDLIEEVCQLVNGQFFSTEEGKLKFVLFDTAAAASDSWTEDDLGEFAVESLDENVINRITVQYGRSGEGDYLYNYIQDDEDSQSAFLFPGETAKIVAEEFSTQWIEGQGRNAAAMTAGSPAASGTYVVQGPAPFGFCGARWPGFKAGSQPSGATLSSTRTSYHQIDNEIIEVEACSVGSVSANSWNVLDPETGTTVDLGLLPNSLTFTVKTRGALGTTAASHTARSTVRDVTIPIAMARARLTRFSYGAPIIKCTTNLSKYAYQIGDLVTLVTDRFFGFGRSSLSTDVKWEIIGKEPSFGGDFIGIKWTLCYATETSPPGNTFAGRTVLGTMRTTLGESLRNGATVGATNIPFISSGLKPTSGAGLTATIPTGAISYGAQTFLRSAPQSVILDASKDNYTYLDASTQQVTVKSVTIGDPEPDRTDEEVPLGLIETDGSTVVEISDMRPIEGVLGTSIMSGTVNPLQIGTKDTVSASLAKNSFFTKYTRG